MFWMVYVDGHRGSEYKHTSEVSARNEAKRLGDLFPGKKVFVLKTIAHVVVGETTWQELEVGPEEIPF